MPQFNKQTKKKKKTRDSCIAEQYKKILQYVHRLAILIFVKKNNTLLCEFMILKHFSVTGCNIKPDGQTDGQSAIL